jgi:parvulin-like peptidyl-prolyl isomerase
MCRSLPKEAVMFNRLCVLVLVFTFSPRVAAQANQPVALVNGASIAQWELDAAMERVPKPSTPVSDTQKKAMQRQLLAMMIDELLLQQFVQKKVPAPDPAVIQQRVAELEKALQMQKKTLQTYCQETGQTEAQLRTRIATVIQWNAYARKQITDEQVKRFYDSNKDLFDGTTIRASHVYVKAPPGDAKADQAAKQLMQTVHREALAGRDFAALAKKYSQDNAAAQGGDVGYFPQRSSDPDPFIRTASNLKVGQISEPVRSEWGWHLIKLTERKAGKPSTFAEMQEEARLMCADELRLSVVAQERKTAKIEVMLP